MRAHDRRSPKKAQEQRAKSLRKKGKTDTEVNARLQSVEVRHHFTDAIKAAGAGDDAYPRCTDTIYVICTGATARQLRLYLGLSPRESIRDNLSLLRLTEISHCEALSSEVITTTGSCGTDDCVAVCQKAAEALVIARSMVLGE